MRYLLDTGILIVYERKNRHMASQVLELIGDLDQLFITLFNYAEFYYGAAYKPPEAKKAAEEFLDSFQQLSLTKTGAKIYAELDCKYLKKGTKIEPFDLLIAAIAIENNLTIITTDTDFDKISEIRKIIIKIIPKA